MKKEKAALLSLLAMLAGCSQSVDYSFSYDPSLPTVFRNGDNYNLSDTSLPYSQTVRQAGAQKIKEKLSLNESVYLFLYTDTCSHCIALHDRFSQFLLESKIEAFSFGSTGGEIVSGIQQLREAYPKMADVVKANTPTAYILKPDGTAIDTELASNSADAATYGKHIKSMLNLSSIYVFSKASSLSSFLDRNDALVYFFEDGYGHSEFKAVIEQNYSVSKKDKAFALVDLSKMSRTDLNEIHTKYGENPANHVYYAQNQKELGIGQTLDEAVAEGGYLNLYYGN